MQLSQRSRPETTMTSIRPRPYEKKGDNMKECLKISSLLDDGQDELKKMP